LVSLTKRLRTAGGSVNIDSIPGHGTRLLFTVPTAYADDSVTPAR
jgi:signal transduction histidine kinase